MKLDLTALGVVCAAVFSFSGCATSSQLTSNDTNLCVNVVNHGYPEPGAPLFLKPCDPWKNQQWDVNPDGTITGVGGFCLDVQGDKGIDGAAVIYTPCAGKPSQKWTASNGALIGVGGKCIDVKDGYQAPGVHLVLAACKGTPTQRWISH